MRSPHSPPVCRTQAGFGQGRFPGPPITPLRPHPRSLDTGSRYHTHHNSHGHFVSGGYMLKLSSDPSGLRRAVPSAPVFPCTPTSFRNVSAGPHVVKGSTVARSPSVGLITHILVGRVSRFSCKCSIPGWPVPMSPKSSMPLLCDPKRVAYGLEWGRRGYHNPQRPVVARASISQCTRLQQSVFLAKENVEPSGSLASCRGGGSPRHGSVLAG